MPRPSRYVVVRRVPPIASNKPENSEPERCPRWSFRFQPDTLPTARHADLLTEYSIRASPPYSSSGMVRRMNASNKGTVNSKYPCAGL